VRESSPMPAVRETLFPHGCRPGLEWINERATTNGLRMPLWPDIRLRDRMWRPRTLEGRWRCPHDGCGCNDGCRRGPGPRRMLLRP
jgi:hypothetical protein